MKRAKYFFVGLVVALSAASFGGGGGGSGVRGGSGVVCGTSTSAVVLDYYAAEQKYGKAVMSEHLARLSQEPSKSAHEPTLAHRLASRIPDMNLRILTKLYLDAYGPASSWELYTGHDVGVPIEIDFSNKPAAKVARQIYRDSVTLSRLYDENLDFNLPIHCHIQQLAVAYGENDRALSPKVPLHKRRPQLVPDRAALSPAQESILELHEALYAVASEPQYAHDSPLLTRELIVAILNPVLDAPQGQDTLAKAALANATENFIRHLERREAFARSRPEAELILQGDYILTSASPGCPDLMQLIFDGVDGLIVHERQSHHRQKGDFNPEKSYPACEWSMANPDRLSR